SQHPQRWANVNCHRWAKKTCRTHPDFLLLLHIEQSSITESTNGLREGEVPSVAINRVLRLMAATARVHVNRLGSSSLDPGPDRSAVRSSHHRIRHRGRRDSHSSRFEL